MKSAAIALTFLLASCASTAMTSTFSSTTVKEFRCLEPQSVRGKGLVGDKAIITADGSSFVVECGDGVVKSWNDQDNVVADNGVKTVFSVSKDLGLVPSDLRCPTWMHRSEEREHNCLVADIADDGHHYLLDTEIRTFVMERGRDTPLLELGAGRRYTAFLSGWRQLVKVEPFDRPPGLSLINAQTGERQTLLSVPFVDSIVGNLESHPVTLGLSKSTGFIIIAFDGAFIGVRDMTYVAAYTVNGQERWKIRDALPPSDKRINGDMAFVRVFGGGEYVAFQRRSETQTQILDAKDGKHLGVLEGRIIDASKDGGALLLRRSENSVSLVRWK